MGKHKHHIVPKHMGGSDDPSNLIEVSIEEHAELHFDLYLTYGRYQDWVAYHMLSGLSDDIDEYRKELCRIGTKNRVFTPEALSKMRNAKLGKRLKQSTKDKMSTSRKGKVKSTEHKQKISESNKKSHKHECTTLYVTPPNGEPYIFEGINEFCRHLGWNPRVSKTGIRQVLNGNWKQYKGYKFRRVD